ncbi:MULTISPECIES: hypothetical protein [unclassified Bradyrhizobium]|uniref:hypothetical protein n=1 Tax=unclassified Bradyrhizobium TaxID=2631580 RepID=UPI0029168EB2|nr:MULTISPECIES: hypothetical protein [unclassified Bradyrhizobium]
MDRMVELKHLIDADKRVAQGAHHMARQEQIVAELDSHGHDPTSALALLDTFRRCQAGHVAHRDSILRGLQQHAPQPARSTMQ